MADGDYYASYDNVRHILSRAGLGVAGDTMYDDDSLETALNITQAIINKYLLGSNATMVNISGTVNQTLCRHVQINLITMMILRARHIQDNNLADGGMTVQFWTITPYLTQQDMQLLELIVLETRGVAYGYDTRSGQKVI